MLSIQFSGLRGSHFFLSSGCVFRSAPEGVALCPSCFRAFTHQGASRGKGFALLLSQFTQGDNPLWFLAFSHSTQQVTVFRFLSFALACHFLGAALNPSNLSTPAQRVSDFHHIVYLLFDGSSNFCADLTPGLNLIVATNNSQRSLSFCAVINSQYDESQRFV